MTFSKRKCRQIPFSGMSRILGWGHVLQIGYCIVGSIKINMVYLIPIRTTPKESACDQTMNSECFSYTVCSEFYMQVATTQLIGSKPQNVTSSGSFSSKLTSQSAYAGNRIKTLITRNWQPAFVCVRNWISHCASLFRIGLGRRGSYPPVAVRSIVT